jgi:hypothetical protein
MCVHFQQCIQRLHKVYDGTLMHIAFMSVIIKYTHTHTDTSSIYKFSYHFLLHDITKQKSKVIHVMNNRQAFWAR